MILIYLKYPTMTLKDILAKIQSQIGDYPIGWVSADYNLREILDPALRGGVMPFERAAAIVSCITESPIKRPWVHLTDDYCLASTACAAGMTVIFF